MRWWQQRLLTSLTVITVVGIGLWACVGEEADPTTPSGADSGAGGADGANDSGPPLTNGDAEAGTTGCRLDLPFEAPVSVPDINSTGGAYHTMQGRVVANGIYFASDRDKPGIDGDDLAQLDLYFAREKPGGYETAEKLVNLSVDGSFDSSPSESADGHWLFYERQIGPEGKQREIRRAIRLTKTEPYTSSTALQLLAGATASLSPYFVDNVLYYVTNPPLPDGGASMDSMLYHVKVSLSGPDLATLEVVPGFENIKDLVAPVVSPDHKTVYFARFEGGGTKVYRATRGELVVPFPAPTPFDLVNTKDLNVPTGVSADGCSFYLHQRSGNTRYALYRAQRPRL